MNESTELRGATEQLPSSVARWVRAALLSDRYTFGYRRFETDLYVCPIVAAAKHAGIWHNGGVLPGHPEWGSPDEPSPQIWVVVQAFDWYAESCGLQEALWVVLDALAEDELAAVA
ncbi:hypothetical protein AYO39_01025 [Actinobacteria bacterium SCGC AG-212-D09]|nr:hypothetical protein AYO39_01025 [Actinobacteria bacterium SCGC AG-212-D09]